MHEPSKPVVKRGCRTHGTPLLLLEYRLTPRCVSHRLLLLSESALVALSFVGPVLIVGGFGVSLSAPRLLRGRTGSRLGGGRLRRLLERNFGFLQD